MYSDIGIGILIVLFVDIIIGIGLIIGYTAWICWLTLIILPLSLSRFINGFINAFLKNNGLEEKNLTFIQKIRFMFFLFWIAIQSVLRKKLLK